MIEFPPDPTADLPYAHGGPPLSGLLRATADDFQVDEVLGYAASGEGEHAFLRVRKRDLNTVDVARELARFAGVRQVNVGFAGLKDRHALTTQFFSVHLPGRPDPDWRQLDSDAMQVLSAQRHNRKIRRGSLRANRFLLTLRNLRGDCAQAEQVLATIACRGVPNYFGPQRFGNLASNLQRAASLLAGEGRRPKPEQRRMLLSAARSYLFNRVLAERVQSRCWDSALAGEVMLLDGTNKQFLIDRPDPTIEQRLQVFDIHPSGPLPGEQGRTLQPAADAAEVERRALADPAWTAHWLDGLARLRALSERRALRLVATDLHGEWLEDGGLRLCFELPSGAFATALVRELMQVSA